MLLNRSAFFIRERVGITRIANSYEIIDAETRLLVGIVRESQSALAVFLSVFLIGTRALLPTRIDILEDEARPAVLVLRKGFHLLRATIDVLDARGAVLGTFRRKLLTIGGAFTVHDANGRQIGEVNGDWKGWNFRFESIGGRTLATITKDWAGIGRELFTTADNYIVAIEPGSRAPAALALAAGIAIDLLFKE